MPPFLHSLPFYRSRTTVRCAGRTIYVYPYQIVVWVAVSSIEDNREPPSFDKALPAVLDTGHTHNFAISPSQLMDLAGIAWNRLPLEGVERFYQGIPIPMRRANVWLFPNQEGSRDLTDSTKSPVLLELDEGIAVFGDGVAVGIAATSRLVAHRLPVLGLRGLVTNRLHLYIDPIAHTISAEQSPINA